MYINNLPLVSVVMAVYNGQAFLREAVDSILSQTYKNFEFIIIDDGSTDDSLGIINTYSDNRIRVFSNLENKGLVYSLNRGIEVATGVYIVRMDADDISLPHRIERQVSFMEKYTEVGVCGTNIEAFGESISDYVHCFKQTPMVSNATLLFTTCFAHPSVIIRKSILNQYHLCYKEIYKHVEDYGLWVEMSRYTLFTNINEVLLKYRILQGSVTRLANRDLQSRYEKHRLVYRNYLSFSGISLSEEELWIHFLISDNERFITSEYTTTPRAVYQHLKHLLHCYKKVNNFSAFACVIYQRGLSLSRWFPLKYKVYMLPLFCGYVFYKLIVRIECSRISS